jgi:hypothetical protein
MNVRQLKELVELEEGVAVHRQRLFDEHVGELADEFAKLYEIRFSEAIGKGPLALQLVVAEGTYCKT